MRGDTTFGKHNNKPWSKINTGLYQSRSTEFEYIIKTVNDVSTNIGN